MPNQSTPQNSTPEPGTGHGGSLGGAAGAIASMLSDNFTISGNSQGDDRRPQQQPQRREAAPEDRQTTPQGDDEPIHREIEEVDDEGRVRFRTANEQDEPHERDEGGGDEHDDDDPDGRQQEPTTGELKDDVKIAVPTGEGKTETLTLGELKKGYLRESDYTRKTQALSAEKTQTKQFRDEVSVERDMLKNSIETTMRFVQTLMPKEPTPQEWESLRMADPTQYVSQREAWRSFKEQLQSVEGAHRQTTEGQKAEQRRALTELAVAEKQKLHDAIPEWKDKRVKDADVKAIMETVKALGFSEDDVHNTVDHRLLLLAHKATLYDRLMNARKTLNSKRTAAPETKRTMPSGSSGPLPTRKTGASDALNNHRKTQSLASGAAAISRLLK